MAKRDDDKCCCTEGKRARCHYCQWNQCYKCVQVA